MLKKLRRSKFKLIKKEMRMSLYSKLKKLTESKNIGVKKELRKSLYSKLKKLSRSKIKTEKIKYMMKLN